MPLSRLLNLFFPSFCPICSQRSDSYKYNPICSQCWAAIQKYTGPACRVCGVPTVSGQTTICSTCLEIRHPFSKILYYGLYEGALRRAVHLLKFNRIKRLASPISKLLLELPIPKSDLIIPVPLHLKRLREREFNQTALIGYYFSRELKIPLIVNNLIKTKETPPQTFLNRKERLRNVKKAFSAHGISGSDVILIDDVITTGATVRECSEALIKSGAKSVTVIALAHSTPADMKTAEQMS